MELPKWKPGFPWLVSRARHNAPCTDMHWLLSDLRYAMRVLGRSPAFTIVAVLVLALAMSATSAIFSVLEGVLLRPLPYRDSPSICALWKSVPTRNIEWDWTSYPAIRDWREQNRVFEDTSVILRPEASRVTRSEEHTSEL